MSAYSEHAPTRDHGPIGPDSTKVTTGIEHQRALEIIVEESTRIARVVENLLSFARQQGATPFMVLLASFQALLSRYSGQQDVCVGTPVAGRNRVEIEGLIGFFVNQLVIRGRLDGDPTFRALLTREKKEV